MASGSLEHQVSPLFASFIDMELCLEVKQFVLKSDFFFLDLEMGLVTNTPGGLNIHSTYYTVHST